VIYLVAFPKSVKVCPPYM